MKTSAALKLVEAAWPHAGNVGETKDLRIRELTEELERLKEQLEMETRERQRWAQQLHDAINQSLFSAGLIAEVLPRLWERDPEAARHSLEDLRRLNYGAMSEMRVLLVESSPAAIEGTELSDLIRLLGNVTAGRLNIPVKFAHHGTGKLPADVQVSLYRLCKTTLAILTRRAQARQVDVNVTQSKLISTILLRITGDAFDIGGEQADAIDDLLNAALGAERFGVTFTVKETKNRSSEVILQWLNPGRKGSHP